MTMKLYWGSGSPFSWRAMLALITKGLDFEDQRLHFDKGEHKAADYLALNPRGRVPTLIDGSEIIYESMAIMTYVDRIAPETPLFGRTPSEAAKIARVISEHESYLYPAAMELLRPLFSGTLSESGEAMSAGADKLRAEIDSATRALGTAQWFGGDAVSAADLVLYPSTMLLERVLQKPEVVALDLKVSPFAAPAMAAWRKRVETIPGIDRAYPPHW